MFNPCLKKIDHSLLCYEIRRIGGLWLQRTCNILNTLKGDSVSHDSHVRIDHDVSTAYCSSSLDDRAKLLGRNICTILVVSIWCITTPSHGWWITTRSIVGIIRGGNCSV